MQSLYNVVWQFLIKLTYIHLLYDLAIAPLGICSGEMNAHIPQTDLNIHECPKCYRTDLSGEGMIYYYQKDPPFSVGVPLKQGAAKRRAPRRDL